MADRSLVRIGLIGCGGIANGFHLHDLAQIEGVQVTYYADVSIENAKATAERWRDHWRGYKITPEPDELIASDSVDAIIVATHHATHADFGGRAILANKHVLVQKPLTTSMDEADRFVEIAAAHPEIYVQCLPFNWKAEFIEAHRLITEGAIGRICSGRMRIAHSGPPRDSWFYKPEIAGFGASMDMGVYAVSGITGLLGPAAECSALVGTFEQNVRIDDNAIWLLTMESGAFATAETAWTQVTPVEGTVIYGTEGVITLREPYEHTLRVYRRTEGISWNSRGEWTAPDPPPDPPAAAHRHFIQCLRERRRPLGTPEHARHVVEIMLAAHESSRTGNRIHLNTRF